MKKISTSLLLIGLLLCCQPVFANSNSEKLQNKLDNYESTLDNYAEEFAAANDLQLPDVEGGDTRTDDEKNAALAQLKYDAALPIFAETLGAIQDIKTITQYLNDVKKKDKQAMRISLQTMTAQLLIYKQDLNEGLELTQETTVENNTAGAGLSAIDAAINSAEYYLSDNKRLFHDALESYLYNFAITKKINYAYTLEQIDTTYDLYKEYLGEAEIATVREYRANAQAAYSEALALYNRGIDSGEKRDLQLLNRALNKMLTTRYWLAKVYSALAELE